MGTTSQQSDLPDGWEARLTKEGQVYYVDHKSKTSTWTNPNLLHQRSHLPDGWEALQTEERKIFYVNRKTQTFSWINPKFTIQPRDKPERDGPRSTLYQPSHGTDDDFSRRGSGGLWAPLRSPVGIRIAKLLPGYDNQPIKCLLDNTTLDEEDCRYQALSYTWGSRDQMIGITCNGVKLDITRNLHSALVRLRDKEQVVSLWVDALCTDQTEDSQGREEREAQVQLMWKIFSKAEIVVANLGDAVDSQQEFERFLKPFQNLPDDLFGGPFTVGSDAAEYGLPGPRDPCWPTLLQVLSQDYFQRVWIIQECVLATKLEFLLGTSRYDGDFLRLLLRARQHGASLSGGLALGSNLAMEDGSIDLSLSLMAAFTRSHDPNFYPSEIMAFRELWWADSSPAWKLCRQTKVHMKMLDCATHKATDNRDRIYSLLGLLLCDDLRVIEVDYNDTIENLAWRATLYLLRAEGGPAYLYKCVGCQAKGPSWTIDLSRTSEDWLDDMILFDSKSEHFNASGSTTFRLQPGKDESYLLTNAVILDRVTGNMSSRSKGHYFQQTGSWQSGTEMTSWFLSLFSWMESLMNNPSFDNGFDLADMWRTLTADVDVFSSRYDADANLSPLIDGVLAVSRITVAGCIPQSSHSDPIDQLTDMVNTAKLYDSDEWEETLQQNEIELPDIPSETINSIPQHMAYATVVAAGRHLGVTEGGLMALLPGDTKEGDCLAIVLGAPIPIVLRETGDGYRIVGSCYIHYMMDGQALDSHLWLPKEIRIY